MKAAENMTQQIRILSQAILAFTLIATLLILGSCRDGGLTEKLKGLCDEASLARLQGASVGAEVLVSLHGDPSLTLPEETNGPGQSLGSFGQNWLLIVPQKSLAEMSEYPGLQSLVIWGEGQLRQKIDPRLRQDLLIRLSKAGIRNEPMSVEARFDPNREGVGEILEQMGAKPRSVLGGVATLDAPADVLLKVLGIQDLISLDKPVLQKPSAIK